MGISQGLSLRMGLVRRISYINLMAAQVPVEELFSRGRGDNLLGRRQFRLFILGQNYLS